RGLLARIDDIVAGDTDRHALLDRARHGRLVGDARVDPLVLVGRQMLWEAEIDDLGIAEDQSALLERLVERRRAAGSRRPYGNLHAFQIAEALVAAGIDMVLAHHQRGKAIARPDRGLVGNDLHRNPAPDRVVEARGYSAASDLEL